MERSRAPLAALTGFFLKLEGFLFYFGGVFGGVCRDGMRDDAGGFAILVVHFGDVVVVVVVIRWSEEEGRGQKKKMGRMRKTVWQELN